MSMRVQEYTWKHYERKSLMRKSAAWDTFTVRNDD
jgi:hypothetical protein